MKTSPLYFPAQKVPTSQKTKKWYMECIDGAEDLALLRRDLLNDDHYKMQVWENLDNDIIDENEIEKVFNPMGLKDAAFPAAIKNYPLSVPKIDLLQGEELKRKFDWKVMSRNADSHSERSEKLRNAIIEMAMQEIQSGATDEQQLKAKIDELSKYYSYDYKDLNELYATSILEYLWRQQDLKRKFFKGIRQAFVKGKEIYRVDDVGNEPSVVECEPKFVYSLRRGNSHKIEDSDIIIEITYEPLGNIVDEFHEDLSPRDIDDLEEGVQRHGKSNDGGVLNHEAPEPILWASNQLDGVTTDETLTAVSGYNLPYDVEGNVRVVRVRWVGRRKIGKLTYFDELTGEEQQRFVSENYKPKEELGEHVKWLWINEAYEGTRIAQDKYVRYGPRKVQMRHFDNPSKCFLGYVGTDYGKSLMARMEPYQYLYNVYMRRLELAIAKYKGPIYELDLSKKPDDWSEDMWMYYGDILGWLVVDSFNEGKKGQATGKLAGNFNTTGKVLDASASNYIQQLLLMLNHIEVQMGKIAGVTDQRQGEIDNRETLGGIERAVTQSSHITEKWFFVHDETKKRVLLALLDTAKQLWKNNKSKKISYIMDDMARITMDINGEDFASSELDLFITDSSDDLKIRGMIEQLSQAYVQNGGSLTLPIKVLRSDSITKMGKLIEEEEASIAKRNQEAEEKKIQANQAIEQARLQDKQADRDLEYYKIDTEAETKLRISQSSGDNSDSEKISLQKDKQEHEKRIKNEELDLKQDQLKETVRHNKATERLSANKPKNTK